MCFIYLILNGRVRRQLDATCADPQLDVLSAPPHLGQHGTLGGGGGLLQHAHVLLQLPDGRLHGLQVALDFVQLLLLLRPQLLQQAALLVVQDLVESSELTFDARLQVFSDSLRGKREKTTDINLRA